jgi:hypothetical protein
MDLDAPIHGQIESTIPQPLGLCVRSLGALVKQRAHERDLARLERDLAIRERDTVRAMLSVTLGLLHMAERRNRLVQGRSMYHSRRRALLLGVPGDVRTSVRRLAAGMACDHAGRCCQP